MQYTIVVAKDVAISTQDFVATWNADPACCALACATVDDSTKAVYEPGTIYALPMLEMLTAESCPQTFYRLIRRTLQTRQQTEIIQLEKPNGARVLVVIPALTNGQ